MTRSCNSSQSPRIDHYRLLKAQKTVIISRVHISGWKLRKVDFVFVRTARPLRLDRPIGCRKASRGHGWFARTGPVSEQRFRQTIEKRANPSPSTTEDELKIKNNNKKNTCVRVALHPRRSLPQVNPLIITESHQHTDADV